MKHKRIMLILEAMRTLGMTTDKIYEMVVDDLERGLKKSARNLLGFVDDLLACLPKRRGK